MEVAVVAVVNVAVSDSMPEEQMVPQVLLVDEPAVAKDAVEILAADAEMFLLQVNLDAALVVGGERAGIAIIKQQLRIHVVFLLDVDFHRSNRPEALDAKTAADRPVRFLFQLLQVELGVHFFHVLCQQRILLESKLAPLAGSHSARRFPTARFKRRI